LGDFAIPTEEETLLLDTYFHFHPLAIEDCMHVLQRPKLDYYEDVQFFVLHALNERTLEAEEVDLFLGKKFLVSYHHQNKSEMEEAWQMVKAEIHSRKGWSGGPMAAAYTVMDKLVDRYFPSLYTLEDELADLESQGGSESVEELMSQVFNVRGRLLKLRRTIVPMRDLMYRIVNSQHVQSNGEERIYFGDIYDHLLKLTDMIEVDREMTADLRDSYISLELQPDEFHNEDTYGHYDRIYALDADRRNLRNELQGDAGAGLGLWLFRSAAAHAGVGDRDVQMVPAERLV
jgi:magnesium transporter